MHNASVSAPPKTFSPETTRRIIRIQALTLVWMSVEAVVWLGAACTLGSTRLGLVVGTKLDTVRARAAIQSAQFNEDLWAAHPA